MKTFTIRGQTIFIPDTGDIAWGEDVTEAFAKIASAVNDSALAGSVGQYDIAPSKITATEDNTWRAIPSMVFNSALVASVTAMVTVVR